MWFIYLVPRSISGFICQNRDLPYTNYLPHYAESGKTLTHSHALPIQAIPTSRAITNYITPYTTRNLIYYIYRTTLFPWNFLGGLYLWRQFQRPSLINGARVKRRGFFFLSLSSLRDTCIQCARISVGFCTPRCRTGRPPGGSLPDSAWRSHCSSRRLHVSLQSGASWWSLSLPEAQPKPHTCIHPHCSVGRWLLVAEQLQLPAQRRTVLCVCVWANWEGDDRVRYSVDPTGLDRAVGEYSPFKKELTCSSHTHTYII